MKVSREQVAKNRHNIIEAASRLFSDRGFDVVTIVDVMKAAGLTHGGFYGYFASKEELINEATAFSLKRQVAFTADTLADYCAAYLSASHRENRAGGCTFAALASEVARQVPTVRHEMTETLKHMIETVSRVSPGDTKEDKRLFAMSGLSAMLGGLILSRVVDDSTLSDELLYANRAALAKASTQVSFDA
jgi:TetR/AcrR family transcriptional repressor of nem operon